MARAIAWVLASTLLLAACGAPPDPGPPGQTRRLAWTPAADGRPSSQPSRLARYQVFGELPAWTLLAGRTELGRLGLAPPGEELGDRVGVLWLSGPVGPERALGVTVKGSYDPTGTHRLTATLAFRGEVRVRAALLRAGREIAQGSTAASGREGEPTDEPVPVTVEVRFEPPLEASSCDQLLVRIEGAERVGVLALEVYRDPPDAVLPPLGKPAPVQIEGEWRRVAGLASGRVAETSFRVQHGHALRIDYGLPPSARGPFAPPELELQLSGSAGLVRVYTLAFEYDRVVVYSEHDPEFLKRRSMLSKLRRIKSKGAREVALKQMKRSERELDAAAFGEEVEPARKKPDPASIPQGLIEGWIARTVDLGDFVGQEVVARLELLAAPGEPGLCAVAEPVLLGTTLEKPLVLLITSDAHRADHLTANGVRGVIETPWIDLLAGRGTVFAQAWSSSNSPQAAQAALFSGQAPRPRADGAPQAPTLPARFGEAGWLTVAIVASADLSPAASALTRDFEQVIAPTADEFTADEGIDTLVELLPELQDQATFVWLHLRDALAPYDPPAEFRREHYPRDRDPSEGLEGLSAEERARVPGWAEGIADLGYVQALYSSEITWIDRRLRPLVEHPRLARALVAFAGTCGESLATFDHAELSPETLRVPLFLSGPGLTGDPIETPVGVHDLGRTLLDLARLQEVDFPGRSLLSRAEAPAAAAPHFALAGDRSAAAVVRDGFLLQVRLAPDGGALPGGTLQELALDSGGEFDASGDQPEVARELRALLAAWLAGDGGPEGQPSAPPPP